MGPWLCHSLVLGYLIQQKKQLHNLAPYVLKIIFMIPRTTELLLEDIIHSADKILMYTRGMNYYDFSTDDKTVDAVVRNIEIISHAAAKIPDSFKNAHPGVNWKNISGFIDHTVLDTSVIDYEEAWRMREQDASDLLTDISVLANEEKAARSKDKY